VLFRDNNILSYRERECLVEKSVFKQIRQVAKIAKAEKSNAPVLVIMDESTGDQYMKLAEKSRGSTLQLYHPHGDELQLNNILKTSFNQRGPDGTYTTYITNRQGGTGTDFPTHPAIEERGGVRVIICMQPSTWGELCQFRRRTGRMTNKGIVHYVFQDDKYISVPGLYLQHLQTLLDGYEFKRLQALSRKLRALRRQESLPTQESVISTSQISASQKVIGQKVPSE
jgi:hypothetical protein